jgi:PEP-CTERM motif
MTHSLLRIAAVSALACLSAAAQAATVTYSDWAYGNSWNNVVDVGMPSHVGAAGGFRGSVKFSAAEATAGFKDILNNKFISYCVEITESFSGFPSAAMTGYDVVAASTYSSWGAARASRLGSLASYVHTHASAVDTAAESTSLQLAIWNIIYDGIGDQSLTTGLFKELTGHGAYNAYADRLLADSAGQHNDYDVFVLTKAGSQDFLLLRDVGTTVPEPGSLLLAASALGVLGFVSRRRGAKRG